MKKAISVLLMMFVAAGVFAGCQKKKKVYRDVEEYRSAVSESEKEESESASIREEEISEDKSALAETLGKSDGKEQLVFRFDKANGVEYRVINFKKNGMADYMITYMYFNDDKYYQDIKAIGDYTDKKLIDTDDKTRCLTYKSTDIFEMNYKEYYDYYKSFDDCTVVE